MYRVCSRIDTETTKGMCIDDGRNTAVHLHGELTQFFSFIIWTQRKANALLSDPLLCLGLIGFVDHVGIELKTSTWNVINICNFILREKERKIYMIEWTRLHSCLTYNSFALYLDAVTSLSDEILRKKQKRGKYGEREREKKTN